MVGEIPWLYVSVETRGHYAKDGVTGHDVCTRSVWIAEEDDALSSDIYLFAYSFTLYKPTEPANAHASRRRTR